MKLKNWNTKIIN